MMGEIDKIKEATSTRNILIWRDVYNVLCRICQSKVFRVVTDIKMVGSKVVFDRMKEVIDNNLCPSCKRRVDKILEDAK